MATVYTEQNKNTTKTWFLMGIFLVIIIALGYLIAYYFNNPIIFYVAIIFSLIMNLGSYWYSDKITLSLARAKPVIKSDYSELFNLVENLSITAGLPAPKIYLIDDEAPNAFATGRDKNHSAIAVTTGLLKLLNKNELEGVIAHELSHIGNRDILLSTVVVVLVGFISILADIFMRGGISRRDDNRGGGILAIVGLVLIVLSPIIAKLIQLAISRKREFLADASAVLLTRYPEGLANALRKIDMVHIPLKNQHQAMAHLYIANPTPSFNKRVANLFSTHPLTEDRIRAILNR